MHSLIITPYKTQGLMLQSALKRHNIGNQACSPQTCVQNDLYFNTDAILFPNPLSAAELELLTPCLKELSNKIPLIFIGNIQRNIFSEKEHRKILEQAIFLDESIPFQQIPSIMKEILIKKQLRENQKSEFADLQLNYSHRTINRRRKSVRLTQKEFFIMELLMSNRSGITTRDNIVNYVWDRRTYVTPNTIDVYMSRLRKKLQSVKKSATIRTIPCLGYEFVV